MATPKSLIGRSMAIVDALEESGPLSLDELVSKTSLPRSTVHRIASDLIDVGLVDKNADQCYRLGHRLFELAMHVPQPGLMSDFVRSTMDVLCHGLNATVHLSALCGGQVMFLQKQIHPATPQTPSSLGGTLPAHCTAAGKVLLGHAESDSVNGILDGPLTALTRHSITRPDRLRQEILRAQDLGFAMEREESHEGVGCLAHPIWGRDGRAVATISITTSLDAMRYYADIEPTVRQAARRISQFVSA